MQNSIYKEKEFVSYIDKLGSYDESKRRGEKYVREYSMGYYRDISCSLDHQSGCSYHVLGYSPFNRSSDHPFRLESSHVES